MIGRMDFMDANQETLKQARDRLFDFIENNSKGMHCPCCSQFVKVYKRRLNAGMAEGLIKLYKTDKNDFVHTASLIQCHEFAQLSWWGLIEEEDTLRPDGGRTGRWRITPDGIKFVEGYLMVQPYALVFDAECFGLQGVKVDIKRCLGKRFNYRELMDS